MPGQVLAYDWQLSCSWCEGAAQSAIVMRLVAFLALGTGLRGLLMSLFRSERPPAKS